MRKLLALGGMCACLAGIAGVRECGIEPASCSVRTEGRELDLGLIVHGQGWQFCGSPRCAGASRCAPPRADGRYPFDVELKGGSVRRLTGEAAFSCTDDGRAQVRYRVTPLDGGRVETISVQGKLASADFAGGRLVADGRAKELPSLTGPSRGGFNGAVTNLTVASADGSRFLAFDFPLSQRLQIMRASSGGGYTVRILAASGESVVSGKTYEVSFSLRSERPFVDANAPWTTAAGERFVPLAIRPDVRPGSILDFSGIVPRAPCGAYGRLVTKDGHFEFERLPGVRQKLFGVNLHSYACYHTMEDARKLVDRFVKYGYNAVRFHNYENEFMGLTMGSPDEATPVEERFVEFDNLVEACRERGVYVTIDLHVGRNVSYRAIGIDKPGKTGKRKGEIKTLYLTNEKAMENFKTFVRGFMNHVNRHTGNRYADEPTLALVSVVNESACSWDLLGPKFDPCALEYDFMREMRALVRDELKSAVPLTSNNSSPVFCLQASREHDYDYVDDHFYFDHPAWPDDARWTKNGKLPVYTRNRRHLADGEEVPRRAVCTRMYGKPFVITEFNWCAPSVYRAYAGLLWGSLAALQDWDGMWRYLWSHNHERALHPETSNIAKLEVTGDPLALASERALMCLFLRGDLAPLREKASFLVRPGDLDIRKEGHLRLWHSQLKFPWAAWYVRLGTAMGEPPAGSRCDFRYPDEILEPDRAVVERRLRIGELKPGDGAVALDRGRNAFTVATERTCGGATERGAFTAGALSADVGETITALWASAMDGRPLATSSRVLLTHLVNTYNTGDRFADRAGRYLLEIGNLPYLVTRARAMVTLAVERPEAVRVYALDTDGSRRGEVAVRVDGGKLAFVCDTARDPSNATYLYELARE